MSERTKYPRTPHLPWSLGKTNDDVDFNDLGSFDGRAVVITEKMDGECTTVYHDGYCHARSTDSGHHPSRSWMKMFAATFARDIPEGWRVCGENLYAYHSVFYTDLPTYFIMYGIYDECNSCLSWEQTESVCEMLGLMTVPVIFKGQWDAALRKLWTGNGAFPTFESKETHPTYTDDFTPCEAEGYVVRLADGFGYNEFQASCAKFVRPHHVKTDEHWMKRKPVPNLLRSP